MTMVDDTSTITPSSSSHEKIITSSSQTNPQPQKIRIVSLLPSITEILSSLGVASQIVGITHECDYPPAALEGARVVTTSEINPYTMTKEEIHEAVCGSLVNGMSLYGMDKEVLRAVRPDLVLTQSLCDVCAVSYPVVLETCAKLVAGPHGDDDDEEEDVTTRTMTEKKKKLCPRVVSMEPENLVDVLKTFHVAAKAIGTPEVMDRCQIVTSDIEAGFERIRNTVRGISNKKPRVGFLEWHGPLFTGGHWIPDMLLIAGSVYPMADSGDRSRAITDEEFISLDLDCILIGPCGFSLDRALKDTIAMWRDKPWWRELRAVKEGRVYALDGNSYYARPGPRLLQGTGIMAACLHGEEVARELGEELAPSSGYVRITLDMYER